MQAKQPAKIKATVEVTFIFYRYVGAVALEHYLFTNVQIIL